MNILITSLGFLGSNLATRLSSIENWKIAALTRNPSSNLKNDIKQIQIADICHLNDLAEELNSVDVIIHTAARAHVMNDKLIDPLSEYRRINTDATLSLARLAIERGVKRFIFISTIKVNGEFTRPGHNFTSDQVVAPTDDYARSKHEAEQGLLELAKDCTMEIVIIRPPLIYGPGVKGNFATLVKLVMTGVPLPLGDINNSRSLIGIDNLTDLIKTCIIHPAAKNSIFLASDDEDVSTTVLLRLLKKVLGKSTLLIPVSPTLMKWVAAIFRAQPVLGRLTESLTADITHTKTTLNWQPPLTLSQSLERYINDSHV